MLGLARRKISSIGLLKNTHLLRFPNPSSLRRTSEYASFLRIWGALHLGIFEQPAKNDFLSNLLDLLDVIPRSYKLHAGHCWQYMFLLEVDRFGFAIK